MYIFLEDSKLCVEVLLILLYDLILYFVIVDFSGEKCVLDVNGNFFFEGKLRLYINC